jgi:sugar phosphate isomerase/epimerase
MPGKSCTTNLLEFMETVTKVIDAGRPFDIVFLDFAKAFDKVPRERLLEKLRAHGVKGRSINWIRNWLTGRKQRVVLNGKCSTWAEVLSGVPQGSVLGPILFLIFINDLDMAAEFINILRKFADDTKLGQSAGTPEEREQLQLALDNLCD